MAYARRWTNQIVRINQCGTRGVGLASIVVIAAVLLFTVYVYGVNVALQRKLVK